LQWTSQLQMQDLPVDDCSLQNAPTGSSMTTLRQRSVPSVAHNVVTKG